MPSPFTVGTAPTGCGAIRTGNYVFNNGSDIVYLGSDPNSASVGGGVVLFPATAVQWEKDGYLYAACPAGSNPQIYIYREGDGTPGVIPFSAGELIIPTGLHSANYIAGVSGWRVGKDGNAEFNNGTFRGTITASVFQGTNFVINTLGMFVYAGTPALGNLIAAIASAPGTDPYGNNYHRGTYVVSGVQLDPNDNSFDNSGLLESIYVGAGTTKGALLFSSPYNNTQTPAQITMGQDPFIANSRNIELSSEIVDVDGAARKTSESWLDVTTLGAYNTNWSAATTFNGLTGLTPLRYKRDAEDNVWIQGHFKAGAVVPGAAVFQLISIYRPTVTQEIFAMRNNAGGISVGSALINTAGNMDMFGNLNMGPIANAEYFVSGKIALGNLP